MKIIRFDFGEFMIYENYIIGIINEGVVFSKKKYEVLMGICSEHYENHPFGYISNRVYSYTIDPIIYMSMSTYDNFIAIAVVSNNNRMVEQVCKIEELFFDKHFAYFDNLNAAQEWISMLVISKKEKSQITDFKFT